MNLINQNQIRGLVTTLAYLQSQISSLEYLASSGGLVSGDVSIVNSDLSINGGSFGVSGDPFYLNTGTARFGINISSPSGNIHIRSEDGASTIWLESNTEGASPTAYPSIKMMNSGSGVSAEIGIVSPSTLPFTNASGNALFINHGASLVSDESSAQRVIQFSVNDDPVMELHTGHTAILKNTLQVNQTKFSAVSGTVSGTQSPVDSTYMFDYRGVNYSLSVYNTTGSRLEEFLLTWPSDASALTFTGIKSPSVNSTTDIVLSGYKSGNYALLMASSTSEPWTIAGIANYLF